MLDLEMQIYNCLEAEAIFHSFERYRRSRFPGDCHHFQNYPVLLFIIAHEQFTEDHFNHFLPLRNHPNTLRIPGIGDFYFLEDATRPAFMTFR